MKRSWIALGLACLALAYFSAFRGYGINLPDEGTLLYRFERMADGQRIYADFHAGGTPGVFYVHSLLQGYLGQSLLPGRAMLAVVNSVSVAMLFLLAAPVCGNGFAALAALLYPAFMPVYPGHFASFNVPYPTWYSVAIFLAGLLAARSYVERPRNRQALLVGLLAGVGVVFKPNIGVFQLACAALLVLAALARDGGVRAAWWWMVWASVLLGLLAVFGGKPRLLEVGVFLTPAFGAALLAVVRSGALARERPSDGNVGAVLMPTLLVGAGFAAVTLVWVGYHATFVPLEQLLEEAFFIGSDYASFSYVEHPRVFVRAGAIAGSLVVLRVAPLWLARRGRRILEITVVSAILAGLVGFVVLAGRPAAFGFVSSVMSKIEASWSFAAAQAAIALAILYAVHRRPVDAAVLALAIGAPFLYLGNYPRSDFMHWLWAAPLAVVAGVAIVATLAREWSRELSGAAGFAVGVAIAAPLVLVAGLRVAGAANAVFRFVGSTPGPRATVELGAHRAPVWMNIGRAESYRDLDVVVELLREVTEPGQKVFTFPALDVISYLSDRDSPLRDSYFLPGWISVEEEARYVAIMEADPPRFAVVLHDDWPRFEDGPRSYEQLRAFVNREYCPALQVGRYAILAHRSVTDLPPKDLGVALHSPDPRLSVYLIEYLRRSSSRGFAARVAPLRYDVIEGYYPILVNRLSDEETSVRAATVSALRFAADDRVASELFAAAVEGRLPDRERLLALRLAGAWAEGQTAAAMNPYLKDADTAVAEAARSGVAHAQLVAERRGFWFGMGDALTGSPCNPPRP
jgi:hypothetical protein